MRGFHLMPSDSQMRELTHIYYIIFDGPILLLIRSTMVVAISSGLSLLFYSLAPIILLSFKLEEDGILVL